MNMATGTNGTGLRGWPVVAGAIGAVLLVPLVAMQFTDEVRWTAFDFAAAAVLLGGGAIGGALALRLRGTWRIVACAAVLTLVALIWAEGAVGIF